MPGGLMQLSFVGAQDVYLKSNPQITFFKRAFKSHSNFSLDHLTVDFNRGDAFVYQSTTLRAKIPRHADLIGQVYLVIELPEIMSDNVSSFRWVEDLGAKLVDNYSVSVGGSTVDKRYGEFAHVMSRLSMDRGKREAFDRMTGNVPQLYAPDQVALAQNNLTVPPLRYRVANAYPVAVPYDPLDPTTYRPSIESRTLYVPLDFWFTQDPGSALPLVALQYSEVEIQVELRPWIELYKVFYNRDGRVDHYAPDLSIARHHLFTFVSNARRRYMASPTVLDCRARLEVTYVTLDDMERSFFANKNHDYLIDQVTRIERPAIPTPNAVIDIVLQNPLKEIVFVFKRSDLGVRNDWFEFEDRVGESRVPILRSARLLFNGVDRTTDKPAEFFGTLQPYRHHSGTGKDGVYVYSFALHPEQFQPSGSVNASRINSMQMALDCKTPDDESYTFGLTVYAISHNFLRISSGLAGVVYSA